MKPTVPPDSTTPADTSAPIAASRSAPPSPASRAASPTCAPSPSALSARASAAAAGASRARRSSTALATPRGTIAPTSSAAAAVGSMPRAASFVEQLADEERVAARHLEARADEPIVGLVGQPGGDQCADGRLRQGRWAQQLRGGIGNERRRLGRQRGIERPGGEDERERLPLEPARDERERARRRRVAPLQVVDHEHERRIGGEVGGEPVQAVLPRVAGIAGGWTWRRRPGGRGRSGEHVRGQRRRSRQPAVALAGVGLQQWALEELAHDPEREPLLELRRPRHKDAEAEVRRPHACLLEQPRLPHPRGALDDQGSPRPLPHGAQRGADALELVLALEQRGRPGKRGLVHAQIDRKPRTRPAQCSGVDVRGCARCAECRSGRPCLL